MWNRKANRGLRGICMFSAAVLLLCGCGKDNKPNDLVVIEQEEAGPAYEYGVAEIGDVIKTMKASCIYRQVGEQEVSFSVDGMLVDRVYVEEGDRVTKGQLLAELSSRDLERSIEDLEYRIARNELLLSSVDTNEELAISSQWVSYLNSWTNETVRDQNIENMRQNYRYQREDYTDALTADKAELQQLRQKLRNSRVYASMDGVIYDLQDGLEGATSRKDEMVMKVLDTSERLFETKIPDGLQYFSEDDLVSMSVSYGSGMGQYLLVPWHMEEWGEKQLFLVYEAPDGSSLEVGTAGTLEVVADSRENVLSVPTKAIYNAGDQRYVYVMGADNMREVRWVETGLYGDSTVEILSGLTEGEKVILK